MAKPEPMTKTIKASVTRQQFGVVLSQKGTFSRLKEQILEETCETWPKDTILLQITNLAARILVPSTAVLAWLKRRMYLTFATP